MHIRTFRAANLNAALAEIRQQMGADASILHTRQVSSGLWGMLGRRSIEVTAGLRHVSPTLAGEPSEDEAAEAALIEELTDAGLPSRILRRWIDQCRSLPVGATVAPAMGARLRLCAFLTEAIPVAAPIGVGEGVPRIVALVGATGVGKTTTVAKLAARHRLDHRMRVGMLTIDAFRAAAVDQIQAFAGALQAPLEVVRRESEVADALGRLSDVDLILVDTVGESPQADGRSGTVMSLQRRLLERIAPEETLLVIDANYSIGAAAANLRAFADLRPTAVVLSKIDEVRHAAPAWAPLVGGRLGISYMTNGQMVPEDLVAADPEGLARAACGVAPGGIDGHGLEGGGASGRVQVGLRPTGLAT